MTPMSRHHRRASAFVVTLWVIAALTGLVLALGHTVRVEAVASANRLSLAQADAAERGAEQFVLSAVDMEVASPGSTADVQMDTLQIGNAWVWILKPDPDDENAISFGLTDEAAKLDLNTSTSAQFVNLPNITQDVVDCIVDWRSPATATPQAQGAKDSFYLSLSNLYHCKNAPFETVEELLLVKGIDATFLFGTDYSRSGHVGDGTTSTPIGTLNLSSALNIGSTSNRGLFPFVTVYGVKASTTPPVAGGSAAPAANVNGDLTALARVLNNALGIATTTRILRQMPRPPRFASTFEFASEMNLTAAEYSKVIHLLTATLPGMPPIARINLNTASLQVLMCLPALEQSDANAIVAHRQANPTPADPSDISWLLDVITNRAKRVAIGPYVTGTSSCFSADILVSSADGRAFKRCRIVVDASSGASRIIYRRDLTSYGWPISPDIRAALRSGKVLTSQTSFMGANPS